MEVPSQQVILAGRKIIGKYKDMEALSKKVFLQVLDDEANGFRRWWNARRWLPGTFKLIQGQEALTAWLEGQSFTTRWTLSNWYSGYTAEINRAHVLVAAARVGSVVRLCKDDAAFLFPDGLLTEGGDLT